MLVSLDLLLLLYSYMLANSASQMCAGAHPTDVRMTTRFKEHDLTEGLTGAIHETGHSLYEQVGAALQSLPIVFNCSLNQ